MPQQPPPQHQGPAVPHRSEELSREREALEELLKSDGWIIFAKRVFVEWSGIGYHARMGEALKKPDPAMEAKAVHYTSDQMARMLQWPTDRLNKLEEMSKKGKVE